MHLKDAHMFVAAVAVIDNTQGVSVKDVTTAVLIKRCFTALEKNEYTSSYRMWLCGPGDMS